MPKSKFRYQDRTVEQVKQRIANAGSGGFDDFIQSKYKKYKVKDGKNRVRILPATWDKADHWGYDIFLNYQIGPDNGVYLSLSKMKGERDPIAEAYREAKNEGEDKLAKELAPKKRLLVWVIDRDAEDEGPQIWPMPITVGDDVVTLSYDEDTNSILKLDHPDNGYDLRFTKTGQKLNTEYDPLKMKLLGPCPISEDEDKQAAWLEYVQENPLPDCLRFFDYDYINRIFNGTSPNQSTETNDDNDGGMASTQRSRLGSSQVHAADENDEAEDEETPVRTKPKIVGKTEEAVKPRRASVSEDDDGDAPKSGQSIRERIAARRRAAEAAAEDE